MILGTHHLISEEYFLEIEKYLKKDNAKKQIFMPNEFMVFEDSDTLPQKYQRK